MSPERKLTRDQVFTEKILQFVWFQWPGIFQILHTLSKWRDNRLLIGGEARKLKLQEVRSSQGWNKHYYYGIA